MRVLVANRGEIARRILRGLKALGHEGVAVYSDADDGAPFLRHACRAIPIGPASPAESYLDPERIVAAGRETNIDAVHPGYGFLSENAAFAERIEAEGWAFVGPTPESIRTMGDKIAALAEAEAAGVPRIPSFSPEGELDLPTLRAEATRVGLPIMIKAAAGGGGKGMRIAHTIEELDELIPAAVREATSAFGDGRVFLERYLEHARHVEVQVLGDGKGGGFALGERDCSIQRRHQKIVEESPAPDLPEKARAALHEAATRLLNTTRYRGAGTVEFILAPDGEFYFLEMNTRLQVEHPVTEMVLGIDLLDLQLRVAEGRGLPADLGDRRPQGHAIEVRVYAENPATGFMPSVGALPTVLWPEGPGIRVDAGVESGSEVTVHYDPLLAKIIAHGHDRDQAIDRLRHALGHTFVAGVETTVPFCREIIDHAEFRAGRVHTTFIAEHAPEWSLAPPDGFVEAALKLAPRLTMGSAGPHAAATGLTPLWESLPSWRQA